ncbi:MAG: phytanoyl-CoA dioxygenase family protein [Pseudomonadota bacterium]|nr:phytanoyl-CoA dioxygenase family protein [Pseudomonadota bacterium]
MTLNASQMNNFGSNGFLVFPSLYSDTDILIISDWLDKLSKSDGPDVEIATYFESSPITGESVLVRAEYLLGDHNKKITDILINDKVVKVLTQLLNDEPVLFKEKANFKLPGCRSDLLHQDQAAGWGMYSDYFVTVLIAIDENRLDNAAVSFRRANDHVLKLRGPEWEVLSHEEPPFSPESNYQVVEAEPGDAIFFDCYVPHGSPANKSSAARRNLYLTFNRSSDGDFRMAYYTDKWQNYPPNTRDQARNKDTFKV